MTADRQKIRTIVVTGAGSGIGRACAIRLGGPGVSIVAIDRNLAAAMETRQQVESNGGSAVAEDCDVTQRQKIDEVFSRLSQVDVLVNSAGVDEEKALEDITRRICGDFTRSMQSVSSACRRPPFPGCPTVARS